MPAYDVTYIDKRAKTQVTKRVYSRQVAAAVRHARRTDGMVVRDYTGGETITITDCNLRYRHVYRAVLPGTPKPDETRRPWGGV
ncbi:hypothetical protein [Streptomyces europaeiscabiei]|uniref:hypothetical protein n=1 Tax=Streptomyces europaeiscabiei TaxID=146819 RepID=UPI0029AD535A|nr:hypothetical protein [Streptomyces europaeiscabiei]MDX3585951.1 hypothetical protein [Streptomyces europaeiscabiei]